MGHLSRRLTRFIRNFSVYLYYRTAKKGEIAGPQLWLAGLDRQDKTGRIMNGNCRKQCDDRHHDHVLPYPARRAIVRPGERLVVARRGNAAVLVRCLGPCCWKLHHDERAVGRPETYTSVRRPQRDIRGIGWRGGVGNSGSDFRKLEPGHLRPDRRGIVSQCAARPRVRPQGGVHLQRLVGA